MFNNHVRYQLQELLAHHGSELWKERDRCRDLLLENCSGYAGDVELLIYALDRDIPAAILDAEPALPWDRLREQLLTRLGKDVTPQAAHWVVEAWALVLGRIREKDRTPGPPVEEHELDGDRDRTFPHVGRFLLTLLLTGVSWGILGFHHFCLGSLIGWVCAGPEGQRQGGLVGLTVCGMWLTPFQRRLTRPPWALMLYGGYLAAVGATVLAVVLWRLVGAGPAILGAFLGGPIVGTVVLLSLLVSKISFGVNHRHFATEALAGAGAGALTWGIGTGYSGWEGWISAGAAGLGGFALWSAAWNRWDEREDHELPWVVGQTLRGALVGMLTGVLAGGVAFALAGWIFPALPQAHPPQFALRWARQDPSMAMGVFLLVLEGVLLGGAVVLYVFRTKPKPPARGGQLFEGHQGVVWSVACSPEGTQLVSGSADGTVRLWDCASGRELRLLSPQGGEVTAVAFTPDGTQVIIASVRGQLQRWEVATGRRLATIKYPSVRAQRIVLALSPDGRLLVAGSDSTSSSRQAWVVRLWSVATGELLDSFKGHGSFLRQGAIRAVGFSPDGKRAVSGSDDRTIRIWDIEKKQELLRLEGHSGPVGAAVFTSDGEQVISGSEDHTIRVWDATTGETIRTLTGHTQAITALAVSPTGQRLVSASEDGTLRVWNLETGNEVHLIRAEEGELGALHAVAFLPGRDALVSAGADRTVRVWTLPG